MAASIALAQSFADSAGVVTRNAQLFNGAQQARKQVAVARGEAEPANEAKGAFLATMSREIRTATHAVISTSGLLPDTPLTEEQRDFASTSRDPGVSLLTLINPILDSSKFVAGDMDVLSHSFDLPPRTLPAARLAPMSAFNHQARRA